MVRTDRRPPSEYDEFSCPRRCNEAYYPLCGINKAGGTKVFTNDCYMSMENCNQLPQQGLLLIFKPNRKYLQTICSFSVYYGTEDTDCPDFDEWINDDSDRRVTK